MRELFHSNAGEICVKHMHACICMYMKINKFTIYLHQKCVLKRQSIFAFFVSLAMITVCGGKSGERKKEDGKEKVGWGCTCASNEQRIVFPI